MAANPKGRDQRAARERARIYQARRDFHAGIAHRRVRDNLIAGIAGGVLILAVVGGQVAYYTLGPEVPAPASSTTPSPAPSAP
ncbi:MAG: dioxygenase [Microbacterium sp.]|nr:dioxygenase [Microbacterium sp.]